MRVEESSAVTLELKTGEFSLHHEHAHGSKPTAGGFQGVAGWAVQIYEPRKLLGNNNK